MPRRETPLKRNHYYHLYNRGHNRNPIFFQLHNYIFFLGRFRKYVVGSHADIIAYVFMPNHYHLLVQCKNDQLSQAMQQLTISYTKAINQRFARVGALFQGSFKAKLIDSDQYLIHLSRYIHLNPVRASLVERAEDWLFSSYRDYIGLRRGTLPKPDKLLVQFENQQAYKAFVEEYNEQSRCVISHLLF